MDISGYMQKPSCEVAGNLHTITIVFILSQPEGEIIIKYPM
jgi:hypothetical protein